MKLSLLTQGPSFYKLSPSSAPTLCLQIWLKTTTLHHLPCLQLIGNFISVKLRWVPQEFPQGVELLFLETVLSQNSRSSGIQHLQQQPLKMKMCSPGTSSASFSCKFCPLLPPLLFQYFPPKLKMRRTSTLKEYIDLIVMQGCQ